MKIILYRPLIPQNTGNIIRTCDVTNTELILVRPLGFSTSSRMLKRAGLDYINEFKFQEIDDLDQYLENLSDREKQNIYFFSSKVSKKYSDVKYTKDSILIFGSETFGLDETFFEKYEKQFVTIPMADKKRCLNLSNSVAIGLYEALRQTNFSTF